MMISDDALFEERNELKSKVWQQKYTLKLCIYAAREDQMVRKDSDLERVHTQKFVASVGSYDGLRINPEIYGGWRYA